MIGFFCTLEIAPFQIFASMHLNRCCPGVSFGGLIVQDSVYLFIYVYV